MALWAVFGGGPQVVRRDGSLVHRQGIAEGAPDAVQVNDRAPGVPLPFDSSSIAAIATGGLPGATGKSTADAT
ncbi:hypothetical protein [Streptomyces sp. 3213.3]|uniref:hypothetical protein n=1 Tax=Streptomyces sp. 3213.3 TaxID=1855348 RepID=UPI001F306179|nr:hypothetical protein [Streptomyces sp. 3213.3]